MNMDEYLVQLKNTKKELENIQEFEICHEIQSLIESIETMDIKKFIDLNFPVKELKKEGFFSKKASYEEIESKIISCFGFDNIFQYAIRENGFCPYYRYANGIHDIIPKVEF